MKTAEIMHLGDSEELRNLIKELRGKGREYNLDNIIPFSAREIAAAEWVNLKCRYGCSQYGKSWCCPPATPGLKESRRILSEYSKALLLIGTQKCPEFYQNNRRKRAQRVRYWKGIVSLERVLFLNGYYKAFSLVGVTCSLCSTCAYPEPCLFPQEKRPTVESFSIDMIRTLKNLGMASRVANDRRDTYHCYSIILLQ
ncbi:MAG: DUF2284 domain-containing protein [Deltaproteobacteria bacterium]|nr:DUF2284 domain-containing protein [Deltaproteobacteria bacterium]